MHRPKNWENPFEEYHNALDVPTVQDCEWEAFEAGADAMLEALKERGFVFHENGEFQLPITTSTDFEVFIPDK